MKPSVLKPGLLVALNTTVRGGVKYSRTDLQADHVDDSSGARIAEWQTLRQIADPQEYERAIQVRGKCRTAILRPCSATSFGAMCPTANEFDLRRGIEEAQTLASEFNRTASLCKVEVFVIVGRVAQDDAEAARAVSAEVRALMDDMQAGIKAANPEAIREAANKAKEIAAMLSDDVQGKVSEAIDQARKAARAIVKRVQKDGEAAADVIRDCSVAKIDAARFAVLDLTPQDAPTVAQDAAPVSVPALDIPAFADSVPGAVAAPALPFALEL